VELSATTAFIAAALVATALVATARVLAALPAGLTGLFRSEFMGVAALMSCLAALRSDFPLLFRVHACETASILVVVLCHIILNYLNNLARARTSHIGLKRTIA
jgi:hypothetical protein